MRQTDRGTSSQEVDGRDMNTDGKSPRRGIENAATLRALRATTRSAALLALVLGALGSAAAEPTPTPRPKIDSAPQHVTIPSLPGQPNREATVRPDGELATDAAGNSVTRPMSAETGQPTPTPAAVRTGAPPIAPGASGMAPVTAGPAGPIGSGNGGAVKPSTLEVRAVVVAYEAGRSVTVRIRRRGSVVTYVFAPGAEVPADLKRGNAVRLRVLVDGKDRVADRVERVATKSLPAQR